MVIISTCLEFSSKLFEKFDVKTSRHEQQDNWNQIITRLNHCGIFVSSPGYLRKRVLNWISRATVSNLFSI